MLSADWVFRSCSCSSWALLRGVVPLLFALCGAHWLVSLSTLARYVRAWLEIFIFIAIRFGLIFSVLRWWVQKERNSMLSADWVFRSCSCSSWALLRGVVPLLFALCGAHWLVSLSTLARYVRAWLEIFIFIAIRFGLIFSVLRWWVQKERNSMLSADWVFRSCSCSSWALLRGVVPLLFALCGAHWLVSLSTLARYVRAWLEIFIFIAIRFGLIFSVLRWWVQKERNSMLSADWVFRSCSCSSWALLRGVVPLLFALCGAHWLVSLSTLARYVRAWLEIFIFIAIRFGLIFSVLRWWVQKERNSMLSADWVFRSCSCSSWALLRGVVPLLFALCGAHWLVSLSTLARYVRAWLEIFIFIAIRFGLIFSVLRWWVQKERNSMLSADWVLLLLLLLLLLMKLVAPTRSTRFLPNLTLDWLTTAIRSTPGARRTFRSANLKESTTPCSIHSVSGNSPLISWALWIAITLLALNVCLAQLHERLWLTLLPGASRGVCRAGNKASL